MDLTLDGLGVLAPAGKRVLLQGALPGEEVRYVRRRRRRNYDEGALLEVLQPSVDRAIPPCEYFGTCGGCSLQHLAPAAQLAVKQGALLGALDRIGGVTPGEVLPSIAGAHTGYRRRARLAARFVGKKDRVLVGFRERDGPRLTDMLSCVTAHPRISGLIPAISSLAGSLTIRQQLPQVEITVADNAVALVFRTLAAPSAADVSRFRDFGRQNGVRVYLQPGGIETVHALDSDPADEGLYYEVPNHDLKLTFGPLDFIQVHREVNLCMIDQALSLLSPSAGERALDLYCGIGNFTLPLARWAGHVTGIEGVPGLTARARSNAERNAIGNADFVTADLAGVGAEGAWTRGHYDLALLDPPRTGASALMPVLSLVGAQRIVYVSCHPGTLARDAGILVREHGYQLKSAGIMDMFPNTSHVESIALFTRK